MMTFVTSLLMLSVAGYVLFDLQEGARFWAVAITLAGVPLTEQLFASGGRGRDVGLVGSMATPLVLGVPGHDRWGLLVVAALMRFVTETELRVVLGALTCMVVASPKKADPTYSLGCAAFGILLMIWLGVRDRAVTRRLSIDGKLSSFRVRMLLQALAAIGLGVYFAQGLPRLERWVIGLSMPADLQSMSGFGRVTDLTSISSLQTSEDIVMRVFSPVPRYLRGQVSTKYQRGRWFAPPVQDQRVRMEQPLDPAAHWSMERIDNEVADDRAVFLPLGAQLLQSDGVPVRVDLEEVHSSVGSRLDRYAYAVPRGTRDLRLHQDREIYMQIPDELQGLLARLGGTWTKGCQDDHQRLKLIMFHLDTEYQYSLSPGTPGDQEPIQRFLEETKKGHCEYFASAMVLLARSVGIPARFIAGYSVVEEHPFGGYLMGRQCDAHAWVEAWTPELGWATYDPTPAGWRDEGQGHKTSWTQILWDYLKLRLRELRQFLMRLVHRVLDFAMGEGKGITAFLLLGFAGYRALRLWRKRKRRVAAAAEGRGPSGPGVTASVVEAAKVLREAEDVLETSLGFRRRPSETPLEFLGRARRSGGLPSALGDLLESLVHEICRGLYDTDRGADSGAMRSLLATLRENAGRAPEGGSGK